MFHGSRWTIFYATALSLACATILATLNQVLLQRIALNRENERNQIILGCFGVTFPPGTSGDEIKQMYDTRIERANVTLADGTEAVYYRLLDDTGALDAIAVQVEGVGLWSYIHGYVAIEADDFTTIRQVNFDKQEETPGLGGEIVADWFRAQFAGKSIAYEGQPIDAMVAKPGMAKPYEVDGISGATITSQAVGDMLHRGFAQAFEIAAHIRAEDGDA